MTFQSIDFVNFSWAAVLVLLVPGAALLAWLADSTRDETRPAPVSWVGRGIVLCGQTLRFLADALALSLTLTALVGMIQFFAGVRFSGWVVVALYGLCVLALVGAVLRRKLLTAVKSSNHFRNRCLLVITLAMMLVMLFLAAILAWRFYQVRDLYVPVWVDPIHHTLLVRKIVEYGGLPPDYQPYVPAPFFYHYGFHLITAVFAFLSKIAPDQAVLWFGQVLNACVSLAVFRLAYTLGNLENQPSVSQAMIEPQPADPVSIEPVDNDSVETKLPGGAQPVHDLASPQVISVLRALIAALLVTFPFQMPAYYLTWGRYTLLSGLILLGPLFAVALEAARSESPHSRGNTPASNASAANARLMLALMVAGMCLVHYFALLLTVLFLLVLGISRLVGFIRCPQERPVLLKLVSWSVLGVLLVLPWVVHVWQHNQHNAIVQVVSPLDTSEATQRNVSNYITYFTYLIGPRRNHILFGIAAVGLLAALSRRSMRILVAWAVLILLLALPWVPRIGPFRPDHFAIVLFFPAGIVLAELLVAGAQAMAKVIHPLAGQVTLSLLVAMLLAWGVRDTRSIVNPVTVLATGADIAALNWIEDNTPSTARFYINSARWLTTGFRGVDGGSWITTLTGRGTIIPPFFYVWGSRDYFLQITNWGDRSNSLQGCTPEFWTLMDEADLSHVYLREGAGVLQPSMLQNCPGITPVYQKDGVFIYQIGTP